MKKILFLFSGVTFGFASYGKPIVLGSVDYEVSDGQTHVNIRLSEAGLKKEQVEIEGHGNFIQINLANTIAPTSGSFAEGDKKLVSKIASFQIDEKTTGIRLFLEQDASSIIKASSWDVLGERLIFSIDHSKIAAKQIVQPEVTPPPIESTEPKESAKDTRVVDKPSTITQPVISNIDGRLQTVAIFLGSLILLSFLFLFARKNMKRIQLGRQEASLIKNLESLTLSPKHKISLIQIDGQKILLSVGPEGISLLSKIDSRVSQHSPAPKPLPKALPESRVMKRSKTTPERKPTTNGGDDPNRALEDVTSLIRKKLKDLPNFT